jgi:predicted metalloprotease with PDZ domain
MRSKPVFLIFIFLVSISALGQSKKGTSYNYTIDLTTVVNDRVFVELTAPTITSDETTFYLPKIIPGTYDIADYGRYIADLQALDKKGNKLAIERLNDNAWKIKGATKLKKVTYWVDDILDTKKDGPDIYPMAATNIEEGKNFVLNTSGFFGYFENMKETPFTFNVIRPKDFYGSTGLIANQLGAPLTKVTKEKDPSSGLKVVDTYTTENYDRLIDSPLMYNKPDTAVIYVGDTEVLIGSYSPNGKINAKEIANSVREVLQAQKEYLGGKLPVDKYAFIFYFFTDPSVVSYGALEHSYSSFYYMPENTIEEMNQQLRDFAAHEFFHIVTPLTIHSEEIHNFDFNDPKMSKHLWLYEGVTEYFAGNVQVKYGLITPDQYLNVLRQKMLVADQFIDDVPFTDISKFTLDKYKDQYYNVYQKGALIGMCLDIKLRKLSAGKYGMQDLAADLGKKFGKTKAFQDEQLFDEIVKLTYPEIGEFLNRYVGGPEKLPLKETLDLVGVNYEAEVANLEFNIGIDQRTITLTEVNGKQMLAISNDEALNDQGKALGFKTGDVLVKMNGEAIPDYGPGMGAFIGKQQQSLAEGGTLSYGILRKNEAGEQQEIELKAPVKKIELKKKFIMSFNKDATPEQLAIRESWLTTKK